MPGSKSQKNNIGLIGDWGNQGFWTRRRYSDVHFNGKECSRCGGTLRYIKSRSCVLCTAAEAVRYKNKKDENINPALTSRRRAAEDRACVYKEVWDE